ncbi:hypothetical protein RI138_24865 [Streptomyces sp. C11-1]|uniref:Integral membrane protein n=1 Tax=Streptomyces durocortorensis TaxID=2811104 RepID=A0ABY9W1G8_9ACTN|nr:hypothetical protein [Streptomyces durocortorensis]WNF29803.1 hypothetical protein RI138_24865 [Streptomyces durocortorensis]
MAALAWVPGTWQWGGAQWVALAGFVSAFLALVSALVRLAVAGADKYVLGQAFRCLPGRVRAGLAALIVAGVAIAVFDIAGSRGLQHPEVRDGRYFALDTTPGARGTVEISKSQYQALERSGLRAMLAVPGVLLVGAACMVLAAGELRRADRGQNTGVPFTGGSR